MSFYKRRYIVTIVETNIEDDYAPLQDNLKRLQNARIRRKITVIVALPMPKRLDFEDLPCKLC
jgi:hypothetical protein